MDGWTRRLMDEYVGGFVDGCMNDWMDDWMVECLDG